MTLVSAVGARLSNQVICRWDLHTECNVIDRPTPFSTPACKRAIVLPFAGLTFSVSIQ